MKTTPPFPWGVMLGGSAVIACLIIVTLKPNSPFGPMPALPADAPDLRSVFASNPNRTEAKQHAQWLGDIANSVADVLAYDGEKGEQSRINTGYQLAVFRNDTRDLATNGFRFSSRYPALADSLETFLDLRAGKDGGKLSRETREKWINAFRVIGQSAQYASRKL